MLAIVVKAEELMLVSEVAPSGKGGRNEGLFGLASFEGDDAHFIHHHGAPLVLLKQVEHIFEAGVEVQIDGEVHFNLGLLFAARDLDALESFV